MYLLALYRKLIIFHIQFWKYCFILCELDIDIFIVDCNLGVHIKYLIWIEKFLTFKNVTFLPFSLLDNWEKGIYYKPANFSSH